MGVAHRKSPASAAASSHAGTTLVHHTQPIPKGSACFTCKQRKVKCSATLPGCSACRRTAKFEGRDPDLVVCQYGQKCGVPIAPVTKTNKARRTSSSSDSCPSPSPEDPHSPSDAEVAEFEAILAANLKALPPSAGSSGRPGLTIPHVASGTNGVYSERPSWDFAASPSALPPLAAAPQPIFTNSFTSSPVEADFSWTTLTDALPLVPLFSPFDASLYSVPPRSGTPGSFHSLDSTSSSVLDYASEFSFVPYDDVPVEQPVETYYQDERMSIEPLEPLMFPPSDKPSEDLLMVVDPLSSTTYWDLAGIDL